MKYLKNLFTATSCVSLIIGILAISPLQNVAKETSQVQGVSAQRIVYGSASSPFVFKVLVALAEKGLDFTLVETLPAKILQAKGKKPLPEFIKASPLGKIPAYQEGNWTIADSSVIIAYLDRKNSSNPLYPVAAEDLAKTLWFEKYGDEVMAGVVHHKILFEKVVKPKLFEKKTDEAIVQQALTQELPPVLDYLEKELQGKKWVVGDDFTAADIAIGAHLVSLKNMGIPIAVEKWPTVAAYAERLFARPSFKKNMQ